MPSGGASARMLPISPLETAAASGRLRFVEGGMSLIIGGTLIQGGLRGTAGALTEAEPEKDAAQATGDRSQHSDDAAIAIVARHGKVPSGPVAPIRATLPDVVPGWYVLSPDSHKSVRVSLVHIGMPEDIAREIVEA